MSAVGTNELNSAMERMARLDWEVPAEAHLATKSIFMSIDAGLLLARLKRHAGDIVDLDRSVEKTTHYKWFLAEDPNCQFQLWLHEYKPAELRRKGHATVAHNHRFWLSSLILRGGFTDNRYRREPEGTGNLIAKLSSSRMTPGDTMVLAPDEIHSLSELCDGTISLIAQGMPVRSYSEVFEDGGVRRYPDLGAKLAELGASL